jgi:D-glycero-D-manno-heptose 1,7-bisphosphate phosphatase
MWNNVQTVFLDRDGVLNEKAPEGEYVWRLRDFRVLDGVPQAIALLNGAGIRAVVVTNQRGVAQGVYTMAHVAALHAGFQNLLNSRGARIDGFYVCPHGHGECNCRKPLPGLFEQARVDFPAISVQTSVMIGDSLVDIEFGRRLGMRTIRIEPEASAGKHDQAPATPEADARCASLSQAVELLLKSGT